MCRVCECVEECAATSTGTRPPQEERGCGARRWDCTEYDELDLLRQRENGHGFCIVCAIARACAGERPITASGAGGGFAKAKVLAQRHSSKVSKTSDLARAAAFSSLTREPPSSLDAASP